MVRVAARAVDGAATAAVFAAVAEALGARRSAVRLVTGERSRTKVLEVDPEPPGARDRLAGCSTPPDPVALRQKHRQVCRVRDDAAYLSVVVRSPCG